MLATTNKTGKKLILFWFAKEYSAQEWEFVTCLDLDALKEALSKLKGLAACLPKGEMLMLAAKLPSPLWEYGSDVEQPCFDVDEEKVDALNKLWKNGIIVASEEEAEEVQRALKDKDPYYQSDADWYLALTDEGVCLMAHGRNGGPSTLITEEEFLPLLGE